MSLEKEIFAAEWVAHNNLVRYISIGTEPVFDSGFDSCIFLSVLRCFICVSVVFCRRKYYAEYNNRLYSVRRTIRVGTRRRVLGGTPNLVGVPTRRSLLKRTEKLLKNTTLVVFY